MRFINYCLAAGLLFCPLFAQNAPKPAQVRAESDDHYIIQPSDVLEIFVWKEPELSRKVLVRPDGRISFPLVQDLQAAGTTPVVLKERIEEQLKEYLDSPNVTIIVDSIQSYKVFVTGKVQKPGEFVREKPVSVLQALTLAGGFQDYANRNSISVIRKMGDRNQVFDFHYDDVIRGRKAELNIMLQSGDVVVVP
jgi:polysaccharide biosynthesis/export protein